LWFGVQGERLERVRKFQAQMVLVPVPIQTETRLIESHGISQGDRARRLQPKQHARRFKEGRFPLSVRANDEIQARRGFKGDLIEAAKIAQPEIAKHFLEIAGL
jgi:hypothetical protein